MNDKDEIVLFEKREDLDREAAAWVARQDDRDLTPGEQAELDAWLAISACRRASYERAQGLWRDMDALKSLRFDDASVRPVRRVSGVRRPMMKAAGIAACFMLVVGLIATLSMMNGGNPDDGRYVTAIGEQKTIHLADGSSIILNTNTDLEVLFDAKVRLIRLNRGEAYFEVAKDQRRRFRVEAGDNAVVAVGTAFAVHRKVGEVDVAVSHGIVELQQNRVKQPKLAQENALDTAAIDTGESTALTERAWTPVAAMVVGQTARIAEASGEIVRDDIGAVDKILDWTDGSLVFNGEPLSEVVKSISRYSGYRFEIENDELNNLRIGGVFKVGDVNGLVEALQAGFGVKVQFVGEAEIKLSR